MRVTVPTTTAALRTRILLSLVSVLVLAMLVALVRALRRRAAHTTRAVSTPSRRDALLSAIASLDARQEQPGHAISVEEYTAQRHALMAELAVLLAAERQSA